MKNLLFISCLLLSTTARADWVLAMKTSAAGKDMELTMKIKADKTRVDVGAEMSMIIDSESAGFTMMMHPQKIVMKMDAAAMKTMIAAAGNLLGDAKGKASKLTPTGKTEKIGEWECEIVEWESGVGTGKFWVAKDFPDYKEIGAINDKLADALGNPVIAALPKSTEFKGMVIKSETTMLGQTAKSELISAKKQDVEAAAFTIPDGYNEVQLPALNK